MDVEGRHAFWATMRDFAAHGRTVLFATHYLEEADANADRIVLMAHGRVVADGPPTEIKSMVSIRTIRATLPDVPVADLATLPGVTTPIGAATRSPSAAPTPTRLRALLDRYPAASDIEIAALASRRRSCS